MSEILLKKIAHFFFYLLAIAFFYMARNNIILAQASISNYEIKAFYIFLILYYASLFCGFVVQKKPLKGKIYIRLYFYTYIKVLILNSFLIGLIYVIFFSTANFIFGNGVGLWYLQKYLLPGFGVSNVLLFYLISLITAD